MTAAGRATPSVFFVGSGPGAADLLTVRAVECLRRADVVVHDRLVHAAVLAQVPAGTRRICIDRRDTSDPDPGATTGELLVDLAAAGRCVVRLKSGDPTVFARLAEELGPLKRAGVAVEIVPGVTAALAAAAAAALPLTSRDDASSLTFVTGHEARGKPEPIDLAPLAAVPGTLAVYMGLGQIASWSSRLIDAGRPGDTPVTLVSRCSWPDQRVEESTLAACAEDAALGDWRSPAILIVAGGSPPPAGPLAGRLVIVTRPEGQGAELCALVRAAGGRCRHLPVIRIGPPADPGPLVAALGRLDLFDWIVFASANGVEAFCDRLRTSGRDGRAFGTARLAAIGPATRRSLEAAGHVCDLMPGEYHSEGLLAAFRDLPAGGRFLLVRADRGRDVLRHGLEGAGHHVEEVVAYASEAVERLDSSEEAALASAVTPWLTVTSAAIAAAGVRLFGRWIRGWRIASLSPVTSAALRRFGLEPTVEAADATAAGLMAAIISHELAQRDQPAGSPQAVVPTQRGD